AQDSARTSNGVGTHRLRTSFLRRTGNDLQVSWIPRTHGFDERPCNRLHHCGHALFVSSCSLSGEVRHPSPKIAPGVIPASIETAQSPRRSCLEKRNITAIDASRLRRNQSD